MVRMSAAERRESVIRAAIGEFAHGGYAGTSTEAIARRVGVSQPYLFRLFKNKRELFLAAATRCLEETPKAFAAALEKEPDASPVAAMATAYMRLIDDRELLLMQLQIYAAVASAEAMGDREFGAEIRSAWLEIWDRAHIALGGDVDATTHFLGRGMMINCLLALGFPPDHRAWAGIDPRFGTGSAPHSDGPPEAPDES
ncbi:helix-turn-helix domain-containing protein [Streptomyces sp. CAU 1734]|uniref:TetR/AcrR family transcriptional regulator n=1 Tax=Streptomyces sp. CAU 1734 TaxID=3140360 RepID=UPI0032600E9D